MTESLSHKSVDAGSGVGRIGNPSYKFEDGHRGWPRCETASESCEPKVTKMSNQ